jgi:two-component system, cell cycle response regulator DivK
LPLAKPRERPSAARRYPGSTADVVSETTILVVDDSTTNREVYTALLEHFGFRVLNAADGREGVRCARECHPDLILMDISMPVMDGLEATRLLKADDTTREIPVIAVTAHDDAETIDRAMSVGMEGYLTKPAPPRRVLEEIELLLGRSEPNGRGDADAPHPPPRASRLDGAG